MSEPASDTLLPVYTLLCSRDVDRALSCLKSLHAHARDPFRHTIIDDGSLTPRDLDRLRAELHPVEFLSRAEAKDRIEPQLRGKPNCQSYRKNHAFGLKLIDSALLAGGAFAQCDSDILFLRPFRGFDRRGFGDEDLVFMKDITTAYSVSYLHRHFGSCRLKLPQAVNAGFMYAGAGAYDLDFIEWFLGEERYRKHAWVIEQTAWAALGGRRRPYYFDPDQVAFPLRKSAYLEDWTALHFTSPLRDRLDDLTLREELGLRAARHADAVTTLRTVPAVFQGPIRDLAGRLYRRLRPMT